MRSIILAAGKGTRLHSAEHDCPKVMHKICGKPLLEIALGLVDFIPKENTYIVVGYRKEDIINAFGPSYHYVEQRQQLGTGNAVAVCAADFKDYDGSVIVTFGDMPMYHRDVLENLCKTHEAKKADCTIMVAYNENLPDWGKVVRDDKGDFVGIIEAKDCNQEQAKTKELFSGVFVFKSKSLFGVIPEMSHENAQNEYYLTEIPEIMIRHKMKIDLFPIDDGDDIRGVNTPEELIECQNILKNRLSNK